MNDACHKAGGPEQPQPFEIQVPDIRNGVTVLYISPVVFWSCTDCGDPKL